MAYYLNWRDYKLVLAELTAVVSNVSGEMNLEDPQPCDLHVSNVLTEDNALFFKLTKAQSFDPEKTSIHDVGAAIQAEADRRFNARLSYLQKTRLKISVGKTKNPREISLKVNFAHMRK
jgi:hypothetical protein